MILWPATSGGKAASLSRLLCSAELVPVRAERVTVLEADERQEATASEALRTALVGCDLQPVVERVDVDGLPAAEAMLRRAREVDADLLLMPAYSRTRMAEWLFAGTARDVFRRAELALLMQR